MAKRPLRKIHKRTASRVRKSINLGNNIAAQSIVLTRATAKDVLKTTGRAMNAGVRFAGKGVDFTGNTAQDARAIGRILGSSATNFLVGTTGVVVEAADIGVAFAFRSVKEADKVLRRIGNRMGN